MKKNRILLYSTYSDKIGGPLTYIKSLKESQLSSKYDIVECFQETAPGGLNLSLLRRMIKYIRYYKPDIVHVQGAASEGFYGVLSSHMAGCHKIIMTVHGFAHDDNYCNRVKRIIYKYLVEPLSLFLSSKVYCVCKHASQRAIIKLCAGKRSVGYIHNPIPLNKGNSDGNMIRRKLEISDDAIVLCITSRVTKDKGYPLLESIFKMLSTYTSIDIRLLVVGDGDYMQSFTASMQKEINCKKVYIVGQTDNVFSYLSASDIFIFPTRRENLSISLLEACASGLACIVSNVGGNSEIIKNGDTGYIIDTFDAKLYADKIIELAKNPQLIKKIGNAAKEDVHSRFSLCHIANKIDSLYHSVLFDH